MKELKLDRNRFTGRLLFAHRMLKVNESPMNHVLDGFCAGRIPTELGQLTIIVDLDLGNNQLTGSNQCPRKHHGIRVYQNLTFEFDSAVDTVWHFDATMHSMLRTS